MASPEQERDARSARTAEEVAASGTLSRLPPAQPKQGPGTYDRTKSSEERRGEQRQRLIDAAAQVFADRGYDAASVAMVLERSGLSRGTFYRHFQDLREVFVATQEEASRTLRERVEAAYASAEGPVERLRACIVAYLELLGERGDLARCFHREALVSGGKYMALRRANIDRMVELFRDGVGKAHAVGIVQRLPDEVTLYAVVFAIEGVAMKYLQEGAEHRAVEAAPALLRIAANAFL